MILLMKTNSMIKNIIKLAISLCSIYFLIGCDKEVSRSPLEPEPNKSTISILSYPSNLEIYLNERNTGSKTPDSLIFLDPGNYKITLKKEYYKDSTFVVSLDVDEKVNLFVDYKQNASMYGNLFLNSVPAGANIFLNDSALNKKTPITLTSLVPGVYNVKLILPEYRDAQINAIVQSSQLKSYSANLRDTSVWIDYQIGNSTIQSNNLSYVEIDDNGILWIGSLNAGLIRFDGKYFTNFNIGNSGMPSNYINCITAKNPNEIWIGTDKGLAIYANGLWEVYNRNNSALKSDLIYDIEFDNAGTAWIGVSTGLYKFDRNSWYKYSATDTLWINDLKISGNKV